MNKETEKLLKYIVESPYHQELSDLRRRNSNYKEFFNKAGYVIQKLLNTEQQFFDYPRRKVELDKIVELYF